MIVPTARLDPTRWKAHIKYAMQCITVQGKGVAAFEAFKEHWSYFPMSGSVLEHVTGLPDWVEAERGTLRVPLDKRLTKQIVRRLLRVRLDEIEAAANRKRPGRSPR